MVGDTNAPRSDGAEIPTPEAIARQHTLEIASDTAGLDGPLVLHDSRILHRRVIRADDTERLQALYGRLSRQAILFRFFGVMPELNIELAERLSHVDYENRMAVVATPGDGADEPIIAVARYQYTEPGVAEFALAVEDHWQGQGIGPGLLRVLAAYACRRGFTTFIAEVMYDNDRMLTLLRHARIPWTYRLHDGHVEARLDISRMEPSAHDPSQ